MENAAFGPWLLGEFPNTSLKTNESIFLPLQTRTDTEGELLRLMKLLVSFFPSCHLRRSMAL